jgi:hypothetical protein
MISLPQDPLAVLQASTRMLTLCFQFLKSKAQATLLKHKRIPGVVDIFEVNDVQEIKSLADDPVMDRYFETDTCPINWFLLKRSLSVLSLRGRRFPTMEPRDCPTRAHAQEELWHTLNDQTEQIKAGPLLWNL